VIGDSDWWDRTFRGRTGWTQRKRLWGGIAVMAFSAPFIVWRLLDRDGFDAEDWRHGADPDWVFGVFVGAFGLGLVLAAIGLVRTFQGRGQELLSNDPELGPVERD